MPRLDLYRFNGAPLPPMYLAYRPPQMLPTITLNPTATPIPSGKNSKRTPEAPYRWGDLELPLNQNAIHTKSKKQFTVISSISPDIVWWGGVVMTLLGGAFFLL